MNGGSKKAPSFSGLLPASRASSYAKKMTRSSNTIHERLLRITLWKRGLRYRRNVTTLPGKPDIVFPRERVAVFCDGDFWHGRHWRRLSSKLEAGTNPSYWTLKISANRSRDRRVARLLKTEGWTVLRIWETDIRRDPERVACIVERLVQRSRRGNHAIH
jgi:DNA mismatch endonuclease, patch repair protein